MVSTLGTEVEEGDQEVKEGERKREDVMMDRKYNWAEWKIC